ncbi:hypothetical protein GCM10023162_26950 [Klenkia terrae]
MQPYQPQPQQFQPQFQAQPQMAQPHMPPPQQQGSGAPPGLVAPLGPPERVPDGVRIGALVVLGIALVGLSAFGGYEVAFYGGNKLQILLWFLPAIIAMLAMTAILQSTVYSVRSDGWVLEGTGVLGRQGIALTRLTSVTATAAGRAVQLVLRDDVARLTIDTKTLHKAGPAVLDVVGRAVWAGHAQGRYALPRTVAAVWGMPTRDDAPARGKAGATGRALAVVGLLLLGTVAGVVLALA